MPDQPVTPPPLRQFSLASPEAHALLAPRGLSPLDDDPAPFPLAFRCINPHLAGPRRGARP